MTQEDKQLLLVDFCGRLPYRVIVHHPDYDEPQTLDTVLTPDAWLEGGIMCTADDHWDSPHDIRCCKPYLRPMSSMTEDEKKEYHELCDSYCGIYFDSVRSVDWLNKKMFDYRGLIPMGLADEAPEGMYNI